MSEPARYHSSHDASPRPSASPGPLRDWLAAMRAVAGEQKPVETRAPEPAPAAHQASDERASSRAPRLVTPAPAPMAVEQDDEVSEIIAENLMLKAKLRLESERRDELQILIAQEIRELRAHIKEEVANLEDLRAERDLWKARCEALMQPLFQRG